MIEKNDHFDNLIEKVKLYKETFVEIVFDGVRYSPDDKDQSWLEQYGLIRNQEEHAVVSNNIYQCMYLNTFFKEANAPDASQIGKYILPDNRIDVKKVLLDFSDYIARIGVRAFYEKDKPYEKTGQFLLTAWLYPFTSGGNGVLHYELPSGLGRMDILLTYKGHRYIIETKINVRKDLSGVIKDGISQLSGKYLATEGASESFLVIFDTRKSVGEDVDFKTYPEGTKEILVVIIGIGRNKG